jgi:hypothetical protein
MAEQRVHKKKNELTSTTQLLMAESLKLKISSTSWPTLRASSCSSPGPKAPGSPGGESSSSKGAQWWCISPRVGNIFNAAAAAARLQIARPAPNVKSILGPGQKRLAGDHLNRLSRCWQVRFWAPSGAAHHPKSLFTLIGGIYWRNLRRCRN